jgi:hypothetical protein
MPSLRLDCMLGLEFGFASLHFRFVPGFGFSVYGLGLNPNPV